MDQIRAVLADMQNEENHIRALRTAEMADALKRTSRIVLAGNALSAALLCVVFSLMLHALAERRRAQKALQKNEKWLATPLTSIGEAVFATDVNGNDGFADARQSCGQPLFVFL